jgi:hypothetical protein
MFARITSWWRRRRRRRNGQGIRPADADLDLERFFTDCETARDRFDALLQAPRLPKRIFVVNGAGAVGKTSLLRMFRLSAHRRGVPVGLVAGEETAAAIEIVGGWRDDLRSDGVSLPTTEASLRRYQQLQLQVDEALREARAAEAEARDKLAGSVAKGVGQVLASAVPVVGPFLGGAGGEAVEQVVNVVRAVLSRQDLEFYLDPVAQVTDDFVGDLRDAADRRRIVLMLDTVENLAAQQAWLRDLVQRLPEDVLFVVAGRGLPAFDDGWPGWIARAEIVELQEMTDEHVEQLVRQYYALFDRGEPDPAQVADVVRFARGLPLAATTAVRLWVNYHVGDLRPIGPGAVADMADRLLENVPAEHRPAFEAAAILRYVNADSLGALVDGQDAEALYAELRRWPFTRTRREGLAVHDSMREVIADAVRARSPERFRSLNEKAAAHYRELEARAQGEEQQRLRREQLYHAVRADEVAGMALAQQACELLVRYGLLARLRTLVTDMQTYPLHEAVSQLWRRYYAARLDQLSGRTRSAEAVYTELADDPAADRLLRAYALCDLGVIYATFDRLAEPDGYHRAVDAVTRSIEAFPALDGKLATNHVTLMNISNTRADWGQSARHVHDLRNFAERVEDRYRLVEADLLLSAVHGLEGDWAGYRDDRARAAAELASLGDVPTLKLQLQYFVWPLIFSGRLREAQLSAEEAYRLATRLDERELLITVLETVALAHGLQDAFDVAAERFTQAFNFHDNVYLQQPDAAPAEADRHIRAALGFRGLVGIRHGTLDQAEADLHRALTVKRSIGDRIGTPEVHVWLGLLHEQRGDLAAAEAAYHDALELQDVNRHHLTAQAWAGLARTVAPRSLPETDRCLDTAEATARRFGYEDVLAQVCLTRGHLTLRSADVASDAVQDYVGALGHAVRHSRYLLDEVLGGRPQGTALVPVVTACAENGAAGRAVLEAVHARWRTDADGAGSLLDLEVAARNREPGTGAPQRTVLEQIGVALEHD